jgi:hypothetical protein
MSSVTENKITLAALGKQEENKNVEIQEENRGWGEALFWGILDKWSTSRK